jgi:hypothetical protein
VGNATTYDFPVRYKEVQGASIDRLLNERDPSLLEPFIDAARELEAEGVRAITGACGFMALFQRQVAQSVNIPVFISSFYRFPSFTECCPPPGSRQITANKSCLTQEHFESVGITPEIPLAVYGMEDQYEFRSSILEEKGTMDSDQIERKFTGVAARMKEETPTWGRTT